MFLGEWAGGEGRAKPGDNGGGAKGGGGWAAGGLGSGGAGGGGRVDTGTESVREVDGVTVVGVEGEERERVGEGELVTAERLERAGAAEERAREARLGLEREGALLGDGLVVDRAELEEAGGAVAVEDGAVGVAARGEAEGELVLAQRPGVVPRLEQAVPFLLELVRAPQEDAGVHRLVWPRAVRRGGRGGRGRRRLWLGRGGRRLGGGGGGGGRLLLFGAGLAHGDRTTRRSGGLGRPNGVKTMRSLSGSKP